MKSVLLIFFLCATALAAAPSSDGRPSKTAERLPGFEALPDGSVPALEDVLTPEIVARKLAAGGRAVTSSSDLPDGWHLSLIRFQEWNNDSSDWVDWELDSSYYDAGGRLALMSSRRLQLGVWVNYYQFIYSYDGDGNLQKFFSQIWDGTWWVNYVQYNYTYDAEKHQLSFTHIKWFSAEWQNVRRFTSSYDGNGNQSTYLYELWDGIDWVGVDRTFFTYDSLNRPVSTVKQVWADTLWVNSQRDSTIYNAAGLPDSSITQIWLLAVKLWGNYAITTFTYNGFGDETLRMHGSWMETIWYWTDRVTTVFDTQRHLLSVGIQIYNGTQWADSSRDIYSYDPYWNLANFVRQMWTGQDWLNTIQYIYTYDQDKNRLTELSQRFSHGAWEDKSLYTFTYDGIGSKASETRQIWSGYYWTNTARFLYSYIGPEQVFSLQAKWNMVSVPLTVSDYSKGILFPTASSEAYAYNQGYAPSAVLENGRGYWMKLPSNQSIVMAGVSRTSDTVDVAEGWNMIGTLSIPMPVSNIASIPDSIVTGNFYSYSLGYQASATLDPMKGYWVKAAQAGQLVLNTTLSNPPANRIRIRDTGETPPPPPEERALSGHGAPAEYALGQNYPNPFNPSTTVSYSLRAASEVDLRVYDLFGRVVAVLAAGHQEAGEHAVIWDAIGAPSGVYFYRLTAGEFTKSRKLLLLR